MLEPPALPASITPSCVAAALAVIDPTTSSFVAGELPVPIPRLPLEIITLPVPLGVKVIAPLPAPVAIVSGPDVLLSVATLEPLSEKLINGPSAPMRIVATLLALSYSNESVAPNCTP